MLCEVIFMEGYLRKNEIGRWVIFNDDEKVELNSGSVLEIWVVDRWVRTSVEFGLEGYYSTTPGTRFQAGLRARTVD